MRITDIRELSVPLQGNIANALVNFAEHTVSLVAVCTDQIRNGKPVTGLAFNSIGRFAQGGLLRERFLPRLRAAAPASLLDTSGTRFDPDAVLRTLMRNEKPGGHGDRAAAVGALELAFWDLNAKLADEPAWRSIARHFGCTPGAAGASVYAAGGYYYPTGSRHNLRDELKAYQDQGYTSFKIKIGGPRWRRTCSVWKRHWPWPMATAAAWQWTRTAASTCPPRWPTHVRSRPTGCAGSRRSVTRWTTR